MLVEKDMTRRTALELADCVESLMWPPKTKDEVSLMRHSAHQNCVEAAAMLRTQHAEIARLQRIIDSRPAMNAGLQEAYAAWSSGIYESEFARAAGHDS